MAEEITKTSICDSCNQEKVLTATPHNQQNNPIVHWYCDICAFASKKEKQVQAILRQIASKDINSANNPATVATVEQKVSADLLAEKAKNEALAPNEKIVTEPIQEAATVPPTQ